MANNALAKAKTKASRALTKLEALREEQQDSIEMATRTAVTMGGALGMAWWKGRYPDRNEILGMDASLVVGGGLTIASLMGWAGEQEILVESLGTGALSTYAAEKGLEFGKEAAIKAAA